MKDEASIRRIYVYKIGPFTLSFVLLLASFFAFGGLYVIIGTVVTGALEGLPVAILIGSGCLLGAALLLRWLHKYHSSSKAIVLCANKVQLPMTKGDEDSDYLFLHDVLGTKIDNDYHDHGPALVVSTKSKSVSYKSMYFDRYKNFENFCDRFESALEANKNRQPKEPSL